MGFTAHICVGFKPTIEEDCALTILEEGARKRGEHFMREVVTEIFEVGTIDKHYGLHNLVEEIWKNQNKDNLDRLTDEAVVYLTKEDCEYIYRYSKKKFEEDDIKEEKEKDMYYKSWECPKNTFDRLLNLTNFDYEDVFYYYS